MTTPNEQAIARKALNEQALEVGRPPGTSPGWTVWHKLSGLQAIKAVRYKADAIVARDELLATCIDWTQAEPVSLGVSHAAYRPIYRKYEMLRIAQLDNNRYWPRPKTSAPWPAPERQATV